jgi:nucleotide-binding universal stress UspA family protein
VRTFYPTDTLTVLSVEPLPSGSVLGFGGAMSPVLVDVGLQEEIAKVALGAAKGVLGDRPGVNYRTVQGDPGVSIVKMAQELDADIIVVGSHGRSTLERLLIGSVANYVVNHAACPVLVIKDKVHLRDATAPAQPRTTVLI